MYNLYLADADSPGSSAQLNPPLVATGTIAAFDIDETGQRVVYLADQATAGKFELFVVELANPGTSRRLNGNLGVDSDVIEFQISPDGTEVIYSADQDTAGKREIYLASLTSSAAAAKLNSAMIADGDVGVDIAFSPDGSKVLYAADQEMNGLFELYLVDTAVPGVSTKVNQPFPANSTLRSGMKFSADSNWIAYAADPDTLGISELYVVATANPGTATKVNPPLTGNADICRWDFSPDSTHIAYCADQDVDTVQELYLVDMSALGISMKVNPPIDTNRDVEAGFRFSTNSNFLVYRADQDEDDLRELYRVMLSAPGVSEKINSPMPEYSPGVTGDVFSFQIRDDDLAVSYRADQETNGVVELYEVALSSPATSMKMHPALAGNDTFPFQYSAGGSRLFYVADLDAADGAELFMVDTANPGTPTRINPVLVSGGLVSDFKAAQ